MQPIKEGGRCFSLEYKRGGKRREEKTSLLSASHTWQVQALLGILRECQPPRDTKSETALYYSDHYFKFPLQQRT